jgi:uncharacterized protein YecT (DUF1311 family)
MGDRRMRYLAAALLLVVGGAAAFAGGQDFDWGEDSSEFTSGFDESKAICRSVRNREPPAADRPDARTAAALQGCDSEALYYGIGMKADPVKARQCAFLERSAQDVAAMGGDVILMTIYANGVGAKRDLDVATRLACRIDGAPLEVDGRVRDLAALKAKGWTGTDFHFCNYATSGLVTGYCAAHQARIDGAKRAAALAALTGGWSQAERAAFAKMQQAHAAYVAAHGDGEVDLSGTARAAMQIEAEEKAEDALLDTLRRLSGGTAPRYTTAQYRAADARLNAAYRKRMAEIAARGTDYGPGAVTREGVRDAQRAWLRYRDAFLAFAKIKFAAMPPDSLAAWLTDQRTDMLRTEE